ncbi:NAD-dependent epimerase/dehydratase [Grosmannia clavigera kw1407]|uniref:NAD-dependent epimerase/dehydratase n=1 Tax=Grosmannia clavigera (strain kw1407 / UAMH 11150) TaxID=655863 RepID=F0XMZ3_GROCL|nr:NAD-dependent epimerase/dehydratase [Grosmannia clavigera kw1407]EFX00970.1 NAD-dependent epimerase/dehydratase [Grosmannia clavigera kw1407]
MASKIFITGVTGYVGGDAFAELYATHPEHDYTLFVRSEERAEKIKAAYPKAKNIRFAYGTLDDAEVLSREAAAADVVLHTGASSDSIPAAQAIVKGIEAGHTVEHPGVYIHISGTGILTWYDMLHGRWGQPPVAEQTYDDVAGIEQILTLPDAAPHQEVDKVVLAAAATTAAMRTAVVTPPLIYGIGRGAGNRRSIQAPAMAAYVLQRGYGPVVEGSGETVWDNLYVRDLSALLVRMVEAGLRPAERDDDDLFGPRAYYFAANETVHRWSDLAQWLADSAAEQGLGGTGTKRGVVKQVPMADVLGAGASGHVTWGTNSRGNAVRARQFLGWKPTGPSLHDEVAAIVAFEAARLGIKG